MRSNVGIRHVAKAVWDCGAWFAAITLVVSARYGFDLSADQTQSVVQYLGAVCLVQIALGLLLDLYRGGFRTGSLEEGFRLASATILAGAVPGAVLLGVRGLDAFPRGLALLSPPIALLVVATGRLACRAWRARRRRRGAGAERVLVYGAGELGNMLVRLIKAEPTSPFTAVGLIDDDPAKRHLRLEGVRVLGRRDDLVRVARETGATTVLLGIACADRELVGAIEELTRRAGLALKVVSRVSRLIDGRVTLDDVRDIEASDFLGRQPVHTDVRAVADYVTGRRVLVTGAGGSIGSELARQVHRYAPAELVLLDRDESALLAVQLSIYGNGLLDTPDLVLADIRDPESLTQVFDRHRPEVVFHAAALKHLPMLEQYPQEGWKTNVLGTRNLLELSVRHGVRQFVTISTDKAADPVSVLGRTKRQAERLTAWYGEHSTGTFLSVRFGNVLGSRGSMLHTFCTQIERGGPVTVTHPDVTRFFMTIPEACELVIQAGAIGRTGEVLVLDMGEPVRILDVARRLISRSGRQVEIVVTGLRPGEKLHERLFGDGERGVRRHHPLIWHVPVPPADPRLLDDAYAQVPAHGAPAAQVTDDQVTDGQVVRRGPVVGGGVAPLPGLEAAGAES